VRVTQSTDQKAGGSSPSERAQVTGPYPLLGGAFFVPLGAMLGATSAGSVPNSAWLMDAATARLSRRFGFVAIDRPPWLSTVGNDHSAPNG
jgi:hypothetical protein